ncbi:PLP-dependent lyase/thiolase [Thalassobaculum fulvum]|uniref:PLP-dependent lyase/thiolase n=2 Tax=Thalassobaculum fulvum TaxID=1633335 RepID=A0A918XWH2_9PROT|nr:PLP-dependent lyase/thiolase [Thalassobaculum fulvum]
MSAFTQPETAMSAARPAIEHLSNPHADHAAPLPGVLTRETRVEAQQAVRAWPGYAPTPLLDLPDLARRLGVAAVRWKDEGGRFGLGSFKALGGAYAVQRLVRQLGGGADITFAAATDGNHGRSVAWGARQAGARCMIYLHAGVSAGREAALRALGADIVRVAGNYDDSVRQCARDAAENGWHVVSDTAWEGYREVPTAVMAGYSLIAAEAIEQMAGERPTHVLVQGGVGGVAAAICAELRDAWGAEAPRFVVVEPALAACLLESARHGGRTEIPIEDETVMAGLSCGDPSPLAWEVLDPGADDFVAVDDAWVPPAMRLLADGEGGDRPVVAGESGVAGLAALLAAKERPEMWAALGLDASSRVLLIGTEGATDPDIYRQIVGRSPEAVAA